MRAAKEKRVGIYCRVSTGNQSVDPQEAALREFAVRRDWTQVRVYSDKAVSGMRDRRPALDELMRDCRRGKVDLVVVWKLDRLGRRLSHLVDCLEEFRQLNIEFLSITESVDTSTPAGRLFFNIIAVLASWERDVIAERVKLGLEEARRKGRRLGRAPKKVLTPEETLALRTERATRKTNLRDLASKYGVSLWCAYSLCKPAETRV